MTSLVRRRIRKTQGRQMIRLRPLPSFQQQQYHHSRRHHLLQKQRISCGGGGGGGSSSCLFIVVSLAFLLLCVTSNFSVSAEGPHCNQVGHGPEDIIMATGRINPKYTWYKRGHKTYVPVVMDPTYSYKEHSTIVGGLNEISEKTCVEFDFYDDEHSLQGKDYVFITRTTKRGCWSYIGRIGRGKQELGLPPGCITHRTAMHEMMHALGFRHEHVRHDRDDYIIIFWGNIRPGRESNFQKRSNDFSVGPYDYDSIMHYERKAFSVNSMETIRPLKNGVKIGVRQKMSKWDAKKINFMYGCHAGGGGGGGGGHLSWSPEHDHDDVDPRLIDDSISPLLSRNASSAPSSSEIEVAYDELDYDPGRSGGGGKRARSRSFHTDDHNHDQDYLGGGGDGGSSSSENFNDNNNHGRSGRGYNNHQPHSSRYTDDGHGHNNHQNEPNHFDSTIGHHDNSHSRNNPYPQSYSHFSLDTYPGGGDGGGGEADVGHDENNSIANDDFYDF